jgi:hypothetical protein
MGASARRLIVGAILLWVGLIWAGLMWAGLGAPAAAGDRHAGYYYPEPTTREVYGARTDTLPEADRRMRIGFVTGIANHIANQPYPPQAAMFAKGSEARKLIIVALVDGRIDTVYRARAVLANMTAAARMLPAFQDLGVQTHGVQTNLTFFDLAKMLGFEKITITNGRDFAYQVILE